MTERQARRLLESRVAAGGRLVQAQRADLRTVQRMQDRCHAAGVPAMVTSGPPGG